MENNWELKNRTYILKGNKSPLLFTLPAKHSRAKSLLWFDEGKGIQRELRYATNQNSPFADEQKGVATLGHIFFRNGALSVPKNKVALQKLLSLYHPSKDKLYFEKDDKKEAKLDLNYFEMELEALNLAHGLDLDEAEAILRVEVGSNVSSMTSQEIKRDVLVFARRNPGLFLKLMSDDDTQLRALAMRSVESQVLTLSASGVFSWKTNGKKVMGTPPGEDPYSTLALWFKTDDGMKVLESVQKKLK